jgi:hypothetical protein
MSTTQSTALAQLRDDAFRVQGLRNFEPGTKLPGAVMTGSFSDELVKTLSVLFKPTTEIHCGGRQRVPPRRPVLEHYSSYRCSVRWTIQLRARKARNPTPCAFASRSWPQVTMLSVIRGYSHVIEQGKTQFPQRTRHAKVTGSCERCERRTDDISYATPFPSRVLAGAGLDCSSVWRRSCLMGLGMIGH